MSAATPDLHLCPNCRDVELVPGRFAVDDEGWMCPVCLLTVGDAEMRALEGTLAGQVALFAYRIERDLQGPARWWMRRKLAALERKIAERWDAALARWWRDPR